MHTVEEGRAGRWWDRPLYGEEESGLQGQGQPTMDRGFKENRYLVGNKLISLCCPTRYMYFDNELVESKHWPKMLIKIFQRPDIIPCCPRKMFADMDP